MSIVVTSFTNDVEGWTVVDVAGTPAAQAPIWIAPVANSLSGACRYAPGAAETAWSFAAPASFHGDHTALFGGSIDLLVEFAVAPGELAPAFPLAPDALVLHAGATRLGIDASTAQAVAAGPVPGSYRLHVPVTSSASWHDLATGTAATEAQLRAALAALSGFSIKGATRTTAAWTQIRDIAFTANPRRALLLDVTAYYEAHELKATWTPVPSAEAYHVEVRDATGIVFHADIIATAFQPPAILASAMFTAQAGTDYDVRAWVVGVPSPYRRVRPVDLTQLTVNGTPVQDGIRLSWNSEPNATLYDVRITNEDGSIAYEPPNGVNDTHIDATTGIGLELDMRYQALVRARTADSYGPWSASFAFELSSSRQILVALRDRFVAHRTAEPGSAPEAFTYTFDATTFPSSLPEHADAVHAALQSALAGALAIQATTAPVIAADGEVLTLTGSASVLGVTRAECTFTATVDTNRQLQGVVRLALPQSWSWGDSFPILANDIPDGVSFRDASFTASSLTGLSFRGTTEIRSDLRFRIVAPADGVMQTITLSGAVTIDAQGRPAFTLAGDAPLAPLTIARVGQPALVLTDGLVELASRPGTNPDKNASTYGARGTASLGTADLSASLDLPHRTAASLTLRTAPDAAYPAFHTVRDALALLGTPDGVTRALATLSSLAQPLVRQLTVEFHPAGLDATSTSIELNLVSSPWTLVSTPKLEIGGATVALTVIRRPKIGGTVTTFTSTVSGTLTLANALYQVSAEIPFSGPTTLAFTNPDHVPTLQVLADTIGFNGAEVIGALPGPLAALSTISIERAAFDVDLARGAVTAVYVMFAQTRPWPIAGNAATLTGWSVDVTMARGEAGWSPRGIVQGKLALGSGPNAVQLGVQISLPIDARTQLWTLKLEEGEVVHVPTFGEILGVLGVSTAALPDGITTLGGLDITRFQLTFDANATRIRQLSFAARQTSGWTIITGSLVIKNVELSLALEPGVTTRALGSVSGILEIAGQPVDVAMVKNDFASDWTLEAAYAHPASVPGFNALGAWLSPNEARAYLPENLPLARGFELRDVLLTFDGTTGATGALKRISFVIVVEDLWTIIPNKLSITDIRAELAMPYPLAASQQLTGSLVGAVTMGDAVVLLTAAKPTGTDPWTFTGSLSKAVSIDLVAVASSLAAQAFALPSDIASYGAFPSKLTLETVNVRAIPDTGLFHFDGRASFVWMPQIGGATLSITQVGGTIDVEKTDAPVVVTIAGSLTYAGLRAAVSLKLGTHATPTILAGRVAAEDAPNIQISQLSSGIGANDTTEQWNSLVPVDMAALNFSQAAVWANFTGHQFLVYGSLQGFADALLLCTKTDTRWHYAFAASLGPDFLFNRIFSALHIDDYIKVRNARIIVTNLTGTTTLGALAQTANTALQTAAAGAASPLADLTTAQQALQQGAVFAADIDFATGSLLRRIVEIGNATQPPTARLYALIDKANTNNTTFTADLPDITLFDTIRLTHQPAYTGIHLQYTPANAHLFTLAGRFVMTVFDRDLTFDVDISVNDNQLLVTVERPTDQSVVPFSLPGIEITQLALLARIDFAKPAVPASVNTPAQPGKPKATLFAMKGRALFGPAPSKGTLDTRLSFVTHLLQVDTSPVLAYVEINRDFSIVQFLSQCITGGGASWASFVDLTLCTGSSIYYYKSSADPSHAIATLGLGAIQDGYHINAHLRLSLVVDINVRARIDIVQGENGSPSAVTGDISLVNPIDLTFAQLAGTMQSANEGPYTGGPAVTFRTGQGARFGIAGGINFLGEPFVAATVDVSKDTDGTRRFTGHLQAGRSIEPFGQLACDFVYLVRHPGPNRFQISNWPNFTWARELVDILKSVKQVFDAVHLPGCGELGRFIASRAFTTSWSITPSVDSTNDDLIFSLTGSYSCSLVGTSTPFVTVDFPPFSVHIPKSTTFSQLPEKLIAGFASASEDIIRKLLQSPEKIATFIGIIFGPAAAGYAGTLLCKGLVDSTVTAASEAAAAAMTDALATSASAVAAAGSAAAAAVAIIARGSGDDPGSGDATAPQAPTSLSLVYQDDQFRFAWRPAPYVGGYELELRGPDPSNPNGVVLHIERFATDVFHFEFNAPAARLLAGVYTGRVRGYRADLVSAWRTNTLTKPPGPEATLRYTDGNLVVSWAAAENMSYAVEFLAPAGTTLTSTLSQNSRTASYALADPVAGAYAAHVKTLGGYIPGDFGPLTTVEVVTLAAPTNVVVRVINQALGVSWDSSVVGARDHVVEVMIGSTLFATATASDMHASLPAPEGQHYATGTTYAVRVRTRKADAVSPWSAPISILYDTTPGWLVSLHDDLVATGDDDGTLLVRFPPPATAQPGPLSPGVIVALGSEPIASFDIVRTTPRAADIANATRYRVTAKTRGSAVTLSFTALRDDRMPADFTVAAVAGYEIDGRQLWTDSVAVPAMALRLADVLAQPAAVASALRDAYPAIDLAGLVASLLSALGDPHVVVTALAAQPPSAVNTLTALIAAFEIAAQPLDIVTGALLVRPLLTGRDTTASLAEALFPLAAPAATVDKRTVAVALALAALGRAQSETGAALATVRELASLSVVQRATVIAASLKTAYEDSAASRGAAYAAFIAPMLTPPVVERRLLANFALADADRAAAISRAYAGSATTPFLMTWALAEAAVPIEQIGNQVRTALPNTTAPDLASALAVVQNVTAKALSNALKQEPVPLPQSVQRHAAALRGLNALTAAYTLCRSSAVGVARPPVVAASLLLAGFVADDIRAALSRCFPALANTAITAAISDGTVLQELYR